MINLTKAEQTDEVIAAREALDNYCTLALRFVCGYSQEFNLEGYTEALESLDGYRTAAAMAAWLSNGCSVDSFADHYYGEWDSEQDFAENLVDECSMLDAMPENLKHYFDYEALARDLFINDYTFLNGFVFSNC